MQIDDNFKKEFLRLFKQSFDTIVLPRMEQLVENVSKELKSIAKSSSFQTNNESTRIRRDRDRIADEMADLRTRMRRLEDVIFKVE